jgi:CxxC motif-containing protein (DUF1111 family)
MKCFGYAAAICIVGAALTSCLPPLHPPGGAAASGDAHRSAASQSGNADEALAKQKQTNLGDPLPDLSAAQLARFEAGKIVFERVFVPEDGLGPLFNSDSCGQCHESPVLGGVGDEVEVHATIFTDSGTCDPLIAEGGFVFQLHSTPLLRARQILDNLPDGETVPVLPGVSVGHRSIPPLFGFGLIDGIPDATILANEDPNDADGDGISGRANRTSDGRLGRFGRKAAVATLFEFNAGAFPNEMGITTPLSPIEETINGDPVPPFGTPIPPGIDPAPDPEVEMSSIDAVTDFTRFLAPPPSVKVKQGENIVRHGQKIFRDIRCAACHVPSMRTGKSDVHALKNQTVDLYSDLLLHDMGPDLADICLGLATPSEFRTEMLMGLRFREQFLHDGSAKTVQEAIERHAGEASAARDAFVSLSAEDKEMLLVFLGTL